jgi:hypothetical protein
MASFKFLGVNLLVIITLSFALSGVGSALAQTNDATSKLQAANTAVEKAFKAVTDAEKVGANVTDLLNQLNGAIALFNKAQNAHRIGDDDISVIDANAVIPITEKVILQAQAIKESAIVADQNSLWSEIALAVIVSFVFVLVLFLVWGRFKKRYIDNLINAKPEVNSQ